MEEYITACPRNCYSTCTFRVRVQDGRIIRILPYAGNLATPEGPCIKGLSYIERVTSPDRIIHPLLKTENGKWQSVSSDDAIDIIAKKLTFIKEKYGPHSILWYRGSGMSGLTNEIGSEFWKDFGGATTAYGNLCWPAGLEAVRLTLGSIKHNVPWDLVNARTIIIWGKNPAETNIQEIAFISEAKEHGCRIIVIDPLRTPTADKADIFISPEPGTDAALALAIAKILIEEDLIDKDFISKHVKGFNEFRDSLTLDPLRASEITGIPADDIRELALLAGKGTPLTIIPGFGLQRHTNGGQTIRSILSLAILTGNIGKPGTGFNYANLQSYIFDNPKEPLSYYPHPEADFPSRRTLSFAELGIDMLETSEPELKAAWIERGNPLLQVPDSSNVRKAFMQMDFRVVVEQFMTDTAEIADIILPAKDIFEQPDIVGSYWSPYVQYKPAVLQTPGDVMPESEVYYRLAQKMGFIINHERIPQPGNDNIDAWLEKRIRGYSDLTLDDLKNGPVLAPGLQQIAWSDMKFETPSGKIELLSEEAAKLWAVSSLPEYIPLPAQHQDFPFRFITPNSGNRIHSQFGNLSIIKQSVEEPSIMISSIDALKNKLIPGGIVRLFNDKGSVTGKIKISSRVREGTVVLPNGVWLSEGGGGNFLIAPSVTDMGYGAAFHDAMVQIEKLQPNE